MKKLIIISLFALMPALSACNTVEGMGQDIQKGGQAIENSSDANK